MILKRQWNRMGSNKDMDYVNMECNQLQTPMEREAFLRGARIGFQMSYNRYTKILEEFNKYRINCGYLIDMHNHEGFEKNVLKKTIDILIDMSNDGYLVDIHNLEDFERTFVRKWEDKR